MQLGDFGAGPGKGQNSEQEHEARFANGFNPAFNQCPTDDSTDTKLPGFEEKMNIQEGEREIEARSFTVSRGSFGFN